MQHLIRFVGNISWEGRSNGLPEKIYAFLIFDGDDSKAINSLIEIQGTAFVRAQGMMVQRDQGQIVDLRQIGGNRRFVPMRWIVSIDPEVHQLIGELPEADAEGVERLSNGEEPVKQ